MDFNHLGLQNCYKFNNNYDDACEVLNGTPVGSGISFTTGKLNNAVTFSGVASSNVSLSNMVCRSFKTGISLSCWFNITSFSAPSEFPFLISKSSNEETENIWTLGISRTGAKRVFFSVTTFSSGQSTVTGTTTILPGAWYFVAATYNVSTTVMNLYLNSAGLVLENSLTISGVDTGDVKLLDEFDTGLSHTAPTGSNRALIFITGNEITPFRTTTSVTYGGVAMSKIAEGNANGGGNDIYISVWRLLESGIASAVGNNFNVTWSGFVTGPLYQSSFWDNVDQTTPVGYLDINASILSNTVTCLPTTSNDGNMLLISAVLSNGTGFSNSSLLTEGIEDTTFDTSLATSYELGNGTSVTPDYTGNPPFSAILAAAFELNKSGGGFGPEFISEDNAVGATIGGIWSGATTPNGVPTLNGKIEQAIIWNDPLSLTDLNKVYRNGLGERFPELLFDFGRRPLDRLQVLNSGQTATDYGIGTIASSFSFSMWLYPREFDGGGVFFIGNVGTGNDRIYLRMTNTTDMWAVGSSGGETTFSIPGSENSWNHIVITTSPGNNTNIYYNGVFITNIVPNYNLGDDHNLFIGFYLPDNASEPQFYHGNIACFRLYNVELTENEAQTIYTSSGVDGIRNGLLREWFTTNQPIKSTEPEIAVVPAFLTSATSTTTSWTHTAPAGTNRILLVCPMNESVAPLPANSVQAISVTYGGIELTKITEFSDSNTDRFQQIEMWTLIDSEIDLAVGSTITITWDFPFEINFQASISSFFENIAQSGAAQWVLTNAFNGVSNMLDLKGAYGDANSLTIAGYTSAYYFTTPALVAGNGYTKIDEVAAGPPDGDNMISGLFYKLITAPAQPADFPIVTNGVGIDAVRQSMLVVNLPKPVENVNGTDGSNQGLLGGNDVLYSEHNLRLR